ncbi:hypothetical protein [Hyphomicrobium sp. DY-1]|uniref:hypothetical protein n=1 Tax=Hyphomicrobium sp. DY-1 TaxID=3075650 RepID=UPI0039C07223
MASSKQAGVDERLPFIHPKKASSASTNPARRVFKPTTAGSQISTSANNGMWTVIKKLSEEIDLLADQQGHRPEGFPDVGIGVRPLGLPEPKAWVWATYGCRRLMMKILRGDFMGGLAR